jgi:hypothetical protein
MIGAKQRGLFIAKLYYPNKEGSPMPSPSHAIREGVAASRRRMRCFHRITEKR